MTTSADVVVVDVGGSASSPNKRIHPLWATIDISPASTRPTTPTLHSPPQQRPHASEPAEWRRRKLVGSSRNCGSMPTMRSAEFYNLQYCAWLFHEVAVIKRLHRWLTSIFRWGQLTLLFLSIIPNPLFTFLIVIYYIDFISLTTAINNRQNDKQLQFPLHNLYTVSKKFPLCVRPRLSYLVWQYFVNCYSKFTVVERIVYDDYYL